MLYKQLPDKSNLEPVNFDSKFDQKYLEEKNKIFWLLKMQALYKKFYYLKYANNKNLKGINCYIGKNSINIKFVTNSCLLVHITYM